jgi:hypothetical protein
MIPGLKCILCSVYRAAMNHKYTVIPIFESIYASRMPAVLH